MVTALGSIGSRDGGHLIIRSAIQRPSLDNTPCASCVANLGIQRDLLICKECEHQLRVSSSAPGPWTPGAHHELQLQRGACGRVGGPLHLTPSRQFTDPDICGKSTVTHGYTPCPGGRTVTCSATDTASCSRCCLQKGRCAQSVTTQQRVQRTEHTKKRTHPYRKEASKQASMHGTPILCRQLQTAERPCPGSHNTHPTPAALCVSMSVRFQASGLQQWLWPSAYSCGHGGELPCMPLPNPNQCWAPRRGPMLPKPAISTANSHAPGRARVVHTCTSYRQGHKAAVS